MLETAEFQTNVDRLQSDLATLFSSLDDPEVVAEAEAFSRSAAAQVEAFYADPTPANFGALMRELGALRDFMDVRATMFGEEAASLRGGVTASLHLAAVLLLVTVLAAGTTIFLISRKFGVTLRQTIAADLREQTELAAATNRLSFRNDQLNALYNVFAEITDTLSLEYVVKATLKESIQIMRADMSTLRILRGDELVVAGAMASTGIEIKGLSPVKLGVGPTGRTAKRGRTMRIDSGGESMMSQAAGTIPSMSPAAQTNRSAMESGLIVPLVVGARVVGTIACWSPRENAFNDEDQRILEMMASQVATAIVAADTTETSERRAHQDPLTSLPNRRQLEEDLAGRLSELGNSGRNAVVAMLDIDYFKRLNDEYGHHVGDVTLQRIAGVLRSSVRDNDHVYRFGGEEFVVVFTDTLISEAMTLAERLRTTVAAVQVSGQDDKPVGPITVSIGLALLPEQGKDVGVLIDLADKAMYRAKSAGRNRVEVWSEETLPETATAAA
ncbi:MAG TPA: sensor domain-containing diguanylate cyclase [Dehalococcoidia bacterium]|nr:sensor domain-containing diguanylate cyclase [Dehalococcoidia bacterium]